MKNCQVVENENTSNHNVTQLVQSTQVKVQKSSLNCQLYRHQVIVGLHHQEKLGRRTITWALS